MSLSSLWANVSLLHLSEPWGIPSLCRQLFFLKPPLSIGVSSWKKLPCPSCVSLCWCFLLSSTDELWRRAGGQKYTSTECILSVWLDLLKCFYLTVFVCFVFPKLRYSSCPHPAPGGLSKYKIYFENPNFTIILERCGCDLQAWSCTS